MQVVADHVLVFSRSGLVGLLFGAAAWLAATNGQAWQTAPVGAAEESPSVVISDDQPPPPDVPAMPVAAPTDSAAAATIDTDAPAHEADVPNRGPTTPPSQSAPTSQPAPPTGTNVPTAPWRDEAQKTAEGLIENVLESTELPAEAPVAQPKPAAQTPLVESPLVKGTAATTPPGIEGPLAIEGGAAAVDLAALLPAVDVQAASFNGAQPGHSDRAAVEAKWGKPQDIVKNGEADTWIYEIKPFRRIEMQFANGVVDSIVVFLDKPVEPDALAKQLSLHKIRTAEVRDPQGLSLGRVFPERGVLFSYDVQGGKQFVAQILIEPVYAQPFVLRAGDHAAGSLKSALADLNYATQSDPQFALAHALRAKLLLQVGAADEAVKSALRATELAAGRGDFQLTLAECYAQQGKFADANRIVQSVLDAQDTPPIVRARALLQQGDLLAEGPDHKHQNAIKRHMEAIKVAVPLATEQRTAVRREAKRILIDAHLAVASDVGRGNWKRKNEVVPKWIERAAAFAKEMQDNDEGDAELMLRVAERALAAASGFKSDIDPASMLKDAGQAAEQSLSQTDDELWAQHVHWRLGLAYRHGLEIEHSRSHANLALGYGQLARKHLEQADVYRLTTFAARRELGWLYFRLGAVYALHQQDHKAASVWYDMALTMFGPTIDTQESDSSLFGEALVSMSVTLWEVGQQQLAISLTQKGAKIVEQAVTRGAVSKATLAVPYGNLATMHEALGEGEKAKGYVQLAEQHRGAKLR